MVRTSVLCALTALTTGSAQAPSPPHNPTLSDVVGYALRWNADLITARLRVDSAGGEQRIAGALPNPTLSTIPGNPSQYSATEALDVGPQRLYRTRAAALATAASRYDVEEATRQVVFTVRQAYFDLLLAESLTTIAAQQRDIVRQLLMADSVRYLEGDLAQKDVSTTELQWAHAESGLARAAAGARTARVNLQVLMGVSHPDSSFRVSGELTYQPLSLPFDSMTTMAMTRRPDVIAARERVDQSRALKSLSKANLVPVPGLAAVYQPAQPFASGSNYALGVSLSVPLLYWFSGERQRANAGADAAAVASRRAETQAEGDVTVAAENFRASRLLAERYATGLLDRARAALDMQRYAYDHGNASLLDLLNTINAFGDTQTDYYAALHDYWVSAYAIDRAVGRDVVP